MHAQAPLPEQRDWTQKMARVGMLATAVLLHLLAFLLLATCVIFQAPSPPSSSEFQGTTVAVSPPAATPPAPPPAPPPPSVSTPTPVMPTSTPAITTSSMTSDFSVDAAKNLSQVLTQMQPASSSASLAPASGAPTLGSESASPFGSDKPAPNKLEGYFYDLKQTGEKVATGLDLTTYYKILSDYIRTFDDTTLDTYYKSQNPLYMNHLAISTRNSADAPAAFHLEKEVQGGLWVIHYQGKVTPPSGGDYQFLGFADNVLVVRVDGTTVLDGGWSPLTDRGGLHTQLPWAFPSFVGAATSTQRPNLKIGDTFHVDDGESVDLDVLIGDDGGGCAFFLLLKSANTNYDTLPDGTPIVPFFQLGKGPAPTFTPQEEHPPFSTTPEPWQTAGT